MHHVRHSSEQVVIAGAILVLSGYFVNRTNPKTVAYYTSLFSVLIPPTSPTWIFMAAACVALLVSASWWTSVALFFSIKCIRRFVSATRRCLDFITGSAGVFFGVRLVTLTMGDGAPPGILLP
jgi:threonine/homoserine/homoserine lactone efflux protein